jgi:hypothetical protein
MSIFEYTKRMKLADWRMKLLCERWNAAKTDAIAKAINRDIGEELSLTSVYLSDYMNH